MELSRGSGVKSLEGEAELGAPGSRVVPARVFVVDDVMVTGAEDIAKMTVGGER